jgi:hypothetical protein
MKKDSELILEADWVLSKCGRPTPPRGLSTVYIPHSFLLQTLDLTSGQTTIEKTVTGDTTWMLRAISANGLTPYWQVILPNGQPLLNQSQLVQEVAGYGSGRLVMAKEVPCPPQSKIQVRITAASEAVQMLFEGAYCYYVKAPKPSNPMGMLPPRYLDHPNQNILAPCWMHGIGPATPEGYEDSPFTYSSPVPVIGQGLSFTSAADINQFATVEIPIESSSDFVVRRFHFDVTQDAGVTAGSILARIRLASGHVFSDDYIDVARYIGGAPYAHDWWLKAKDTIILDLQLVDFVGTIGTEQMYMQVHVEGVKRRKADV